MNKHILYTSIVIFFIVFIFPFLSLVFLDFIPGNDQAGFGGHSTKIVYGEIVVKQNFISTGNNLSGVGLSIKNPANINKKEIFLKIYEQENLIRTSSLNGYSIRDGTFVKFLFEPITDSKNREFTFEISSPSSLDSEAIGAFWEDKKGVPVVYYYKPKNKLEVVNEVLINLFSRFQLLGSQKF